MGQAWSFEGELSALCDLNTARKYLGSCRCVCELVCRTMWALQGLELMWARVHVTYPTSLKAHRKDALPLRTDTSSHKKCGAFLPSNANCARFLVCIVSSPPHTNTKELVLP